jgi:hypothetical protein
MMSVVAEAEAADPIATAAAAIRRCLKIDFTTRPR